VSGGTLDAEFPARSLTLLVLRPAARLTSASGRITYTAPHGQANRVTVERVTGKLRVSDPGAGRIVVSSPCTAISATVAECPSSGIGTVDVRAGDGNDTLTSKLGSGDAATADLRGGDGADTLYGAGDADTLRGEAGNDVLSGGLGGDAFDGGSGTDTMTYAGRTGRLAVRLDGLRNDGYDPNGSGASGTGEENDRDVAVENVIGGSAGDLLVATAANTVVNTLRGGAGNDTLLTRDGTAAVDRLYCETGTLDNFDADAADAVTGCEVAGRRAR
jgi:hypothetical protein